MKNLKSMFRVFLAGSLLSFSLIFSTSSVCGEWELKKDDSGIKIYTRNVDDSALKEFKGVTNVNASTEQVLTLLRNANAFSKWMPDTKSSKLLKTSEKEQYHYILTDMPWPIADRDGVYHFTYTTHQAEPTPYVEIIVESTPNYLPKKDRKIRIPKANGTWRILPAGQQVEVTYQMHVDPGGSLPIWLINSSVIDTPFNLLKGLKIRLSRD